jgi:signal peptidase I
MPEKAIQPSPWISIWVAPCRTIERILAAPPRQSLVLLLAALGAIATLFHHFLNFRLAGQWFHWPILLGFAVLGAVFGIVGLYGSALLFKAIGRLMGGRASAVELRTLFAWSALPSILGLAVVLAAGIALGFSENPAAPGWLSPLLQVVVILCGFWSIVILLLMLSRVEGFGFWRTIFTYILSLFLIVLFTMLFRSFLFHPFNIPSRAMAPTLLEGDQFFLSKYPYGFTRYSLPFSPPLFSGRIFGSEPARGDVVVFRLPKDDSVDYVKRVVGLPGERIQMKQGVLAINDVPVTRERLPDFVGDDQCGGTGTGVKVKRWRETLPNGVSHETLDCLDNGFFDNTNVYTVPAGHFFVLGDNRDNSTDSRVLAAVGYVPFENIVGRAGMIFFSSTPGQGAAAPVIRSERIGMMVR